MRWRGIQGETNPVPKGAIEGRVPRRVEVDRKRRIWPDVVHSHGSSERQCHGQRRRVRAARCSELPSGTGNGPGEGSADALNSEVARAAKTRRMCRSSGSTPTAPRRAAASVVLNNLLDSWSGKTAEGLTAEEKQTRTNIITSLVSGVGAALGGDSRVAALAAQIETENNYLGQIGTDSARSEQARYDRLMSECQKGIQNACEQARNERHVRATDRALKAACFQPGSLPCQVAVKQVKETGNIVLFGNREGTPVVYPANTPIIQATPDVRGGSFQGMLSNSVAEGSHR